MINGSQLRDAYISAANHIVARRQEVDALNVFPVPDGDTGTNMSMTISAAVPELKLMENPTVAAGGKTAASPFCYGAPAEIRVLFYPCCSADFPKVWRVKKKRTVPILHRL